MHSPSRKKILYIVSSAPRRGFGGQLRALHIGRALKDVGDVTVMIASASAREEHPTGSDEFTYVAPVEAAVLPKRRFRSLGRLFDSGAMDVHGIAPTPEDQRRVAATAAEHDLTWILNSRTANILNRWAWPRTHLDVDDLPSAYLASVSAQERRLAPRLKALMQGWAAKRRERRFPERFTTLSVCSEPDRAQFSSQEGIHVIPNAFARPATEPRRRLIPTQPRLGFIGLYSYEPNRQGMEWFFQDCWPKIVAQVPDVRLRMIGKGTDAALRPNIPGVEPLGWVADPEEEIASWSAMVIPIHLGAGTRVKLAEAFGRKCPVVSTRLGAFGYEVEDKRQLFLADSAPDFVAACVAALRDPAGAQQMAERAWADFLQKWTWDAISPRVWAAAEDCLRRSAIQSRG